MQFEHHDYRTPSGKIELTGSAFIDAGLPRAPFASAEARPAGGELRLLSPASKWLMNSSFGNDPKILKQLGEDQAFVHPEEAQARGIANGARVRIGNPTGAITLRLCVSARCAEGRHSGPQEPLDGKRHPATMSTPSIQAIRRISRRAAPCTVSTCRLPPPKRL